MNNHIKANEIHRIFCAGTIADLPPSISISELLMQMNGARVAFQAPIAKYGEKVNKCRRASCFKPTPKHLLDKRGYCPECVKVVRPYRSTGKRETK